MHRSFKAGFVGTVLIGIFLFVAVSYAIDLGTGEESFLQNARNTAGYTDANETTIASMIGMIIKAILSISGVIFTALLVYAGILWMTAGGEDEQVTKSKGIIRASIIGLIITLGAYSISYFVVPRILQQTLGDAPAEGEDGPPQFVNCCIDCGGGTILGSSCSGGTTGRRFPIDPAQNETCDSLCQNEGSCGSIGVLEQSQCQ